MNEMIGIAICVASGLACFKLFMKCIDWFDNLYIVNGRKKLVK